MEQLNANPADLLRTAEVYSGLADRVAALPSRAFAQAQRVAETHGPMGYPAAMGISVGLATAEKPVSAKAADFQRYSQRFIEHAVTYVGEDQEAARRYRGPTNDLFAPANTVSAISVAAAGDAVIIWCTPTPAGFRCTNLFPDGTVVVYPSPTDRTGVWLP